MNSAQMEMLQQLAMALRQVAGVVPAPQPVLMPAPVAERDRKPPIEKLRKYGAKEFRAAKDDDSSVAEYWLEGTIRALEQMRCPAPQPVPMLHLWQKEIGSLQLRNYESMG